MGAPTVNYQMMANSYELSGDARSGLHAKADFLMAWSDAFTFANQILIAPSATHVGGISWNAPWQFPVAFGSGPTPPVYAQSFVIKPCGASGSAVPNKGMAPGEYYTNAIVTVQFDSIQYIQQTSDDPSGLNQLDPANPITACEQSVEINGKIVTSKGASWLYTSGSYSGKPVLGDVPLNRNEVKLVCAFPRVPYLPWQLVQPYVGKLNNATILACVKGALLLEGMGTKITGMTNGEIGQSVVLKFAFNPDWTGNSTQGLDWNSFDFPDGSGTSVLNSSDGSGKTPYKYVSFSSIFTGLLF